MNGLDSEAKNHLTRICRHDGDTRANRYKAYRYLARRHKAGQLLDVRDFPTTVQEHFAGVAHQREGDGEWPVKSSP